LFHDAASAPPNNDFNLKSRAKMHLGFPVELVYELSSIQASINPMSQPVEILYAVPVGAIIAWYPPGSEKLPPGFAFCNGGIVNDPDSPFNTKPTPDLNSRFILGASTVTAPPATGGSVDLNLRGFTNSAYALTTSPTQSSSSDNVANNVIIRDNPDDTQYRYGMVGENPNDGWHDGNHHHVATVDSVHVPAPGWLALLYIMRIK
jgi:hypothetical protein